VVATDAFLKELRQAEVTGAVSLACGKGNGRDQVARVRLVHQSTYLPAFDPCLPLIQNFFDLIDGARFDLPIEPQEASAGNNAAHRKFARDSIFSTIR
jgi:hypothetical protein